MVWHMAIIYLIPKIVLKDCQAIPKECLKNSRDRGAELHDLFNGPGTRRGQIPDRRGRLARGSRPNPFLLDGIDSHGLPWDPLIKIHLGY